VANIFFCNIANIWQIFHLKLANNDQKIFSSATLPIFVRYSHLQLFNIWKIFSPATLQIFGRSPLQHCQYLADILICNLPTFGKYSTLQLHLYLANILLCNIPNFWQIFFSAALSTFGRYSHL